MIDSNKINRVFIVAEIGNNHEGNFNQAIKLIESAAEAGVDAVKFQTFIPEQYVSKADQVRLDRLRRFKLSNNEFISLSKKAHELNLKFFSTPFDLESAEFLNEIQTIFKISSGDNNFFPLIKKIALFNKPTILSTGLINISQLKGIIRFWCENGGELKNLSLLHCVSSYPTPAEYANIAAINDLRVNFPGVTVGYSDHTLGTKACILAVGAGAMIIEKHFTLDKASSDFRDHHLSADPIEMHALVKEIRQAEIFMGSGVKEIQNCELESLVGMRRSIAAKRDLYAGNSIYINDITWVRPGNGIPAGDEDKIIGKKIIKKIEQGELITLDNLS
jgi:N,N'-diacetyllegionaminate synthase